MSQLQEQLIPDNSFPPGRNDPCFCGSGQRFRQCCGNTYEDRAVPSGIEIEPAFLSPAQCQELVQLFDTLEGERFKVRDRSDPGAISLDPTRVCEWTQMGEQQAVLDQLVARAFEEVIIPRGGQSIDFYEEPQLLRYQAGGFYQYHSDAYNLVPEREAWRKAVDRDISMLIYLNEDFEGGELEFKRFRYFLKPRSGMLVWFPSDMRYEHMARPVTAGRRYAIVSWASAEGVPKVQARRAKRSIDWQTRQKLQD